MINNLINFFNTIKKSLIIFYPKGYIAYNEKNVLVTSVVIMLFIVIPVIFLNFLFIKKYKENQLTEYSPNWNKSKIIEFFCWGIPCIIILILSIISWRTTHSLDPYKSLPFKKPIENIEVVSLQWKWLFIYPKEKIATINYLVIPENQPITLYITADSPMNSFIIPQIAGQVYSMNGMVTNLHIIGEKGKYFGLSANYSGDGFANMIFPVFIISKDNFLSWTKTVHKKYEKNILNNTKYNNISKPSTYKGKYLFIIKDNSLFYSILNKFNTTGKKYLLG